jgi:hypothetical protein
MFKVAKEVIWIKKFIIELGVVPSIVNPIALYYDNNRVIVKPKESRIINDLNMYLGDSFD